MVDILYFQVWFRYCRGIAI